MPITYEIHHDQRLVRARVTGTLTKEDAFTYQRDVWSLPEVRGYNQLVDATDMAGVDIPFPSAEAMRELASLAAGMDDPSLQTRFAIVATSALAYGLARMYATYRALDPRSTRAVSVFRSVPDALAWLSHAEPAPGAGPNPP